AHRDEREDEQQDHARVEEQRAYQLLVDVHGAAFDAAELRALLVEDDQHRVEEVAEQQREEADHDIRNRRGEVRLQLLVRNREDVVHCTSSSEVAISGSVAAAAVAGVSSVVTCRKISSRLKRIGRISSSPQPRPTTAAASSRRTSRPASLSTSKPTTCWLLSAIATRVTPETRSSTDATSAPPASTCRYIVS